MRPENQRMKAYLKANGIGAQPKYLAAGSLRGCWRLYDPDQKWTDTLRDALTRLGFRDYNNAPLNQYSGNGGVFSVLVRGHNELLTKPRHSPNLLKVCEEIANDPKCDLVHSERRIRLYAAIADTGGNI